jgi:fibronectin-binding autotransporter adhesin
MPCRLASRLSIILLAGIALFWHSQSSFAQTNGTWASSGGGTWSTAANWQGAIPDAGGIATFDNALGQIGNIGVILDSNRTLGEIRFNQGFSASILGSGGGILMSGSGLTLNSQASTISSPTIFYNSVNLLSPVISGTGDLIKTGVGNVALSASTANTFTGTVRINNGALWLVGGTAALQNSQLGNTANVIELNGGILGITTNALTSARALSISAGGGTIRNFNTTSTFSGALSGAGQLVVQLGTTTFSGSVSGFTGLLRIDGGGGIVTLTGTSALGAGGVVQVGGQLNLTYSTNNITNRLAGRNAESLGGNFVLTGSSAAASNETAGDLNLLSGTTTITLAPNAAQATNLTFGTLTRTDRSTLYIRSSNTLGAAPAAGVGNVSFTNSPGTLVGGGGATTSTTASILPFVLGSNVNNTTFGVSLSFVTWDSTTKRIAALNTTSGYQTNLATASSNENVSLAANASVAVNGQTVNSLRFGGAFTLSGGAADVLTITSGAILSTTSTSTISAPINFGAAEGVIYSSGALTINGVISGTNGLTKAGISILTLNGANTYTGDTTLTLGQTRVAGGTVTADGSAPSVFGQGTSAITLLSTNNTVTGAPTRLFTTGNLIINRDLIVKLGGGQATGIGTVGASAAESVTLNGQLFLNAVNPTSLTRFLTLEGDTTIANAITLNGVVSGTGGLRASTANYAILSNSNTYSGGTQIGLSFYDDTLTGNAFKNFTETWDLRSNNALGTGTVFIHSALSTTQPVTGVGRILSNGSSAITLPNDFVFTMGFGNFDGSQGLTISGGIELNSAGTNNTVVTTNSTGPLNFTGVVARGGLIKNGSGTLNLSGNNIYSGQTIIRQGTVGITSLGNGGTAANLGQAPTASNYIILSGNAASNFGTLSYTGSGDAVNRLFTVAGTGGTIDSSGPGALSFNNTGNLGSVDGSTTISSVALVANAGVIAIDTSIAAQLVVGSTVTSSYAGFPTGATITEVGPNFIRLSGTGTNIATVFTTTPAVDTRTTLTITLPGAVTTRALNLTGTNTSFNTIASVIPNGTNIPVAVSKSGVGTWQLTGANTYSGGTNVTGGTLAINNTTGSGTGFGSVLTAANTTLSGIGKIVPNTGNTVTINGTVAPGNSVGTLTFGSSTTSTTVNVNAAYAFELQTAGTTGVALNSGGSSPGLPHTAHDVINAFGTLTFGGSSTVNVASLTGTGFDNTQKYSWLIATINGGTLSGVPTLGVVSGTDFSSLAGGTFTIGSDSGAVYLNFTPVPEPLTILSLSALGLAAVQGVRRRRRRSTTTALAA